MGEEVAGFQKYKGAQRAIVALLYANDTFGAEVEWLIQGDDDTLFTSSPHANCTVTSWRASGAKRASSPRPPPPPRGGMWPR